MSPGPLTKELVLGQGADGSETGAGELIVSSTTGGGGSGTIPIFRSAFTVAERGPLGIDLRPEDLVGWAAWPGSCLERAGVRSSVVDKRVGGTVRRERQGLPVGAVGVAKGVNSSAERGKVGATLSQDIVTSTEDSEVRHISRSKGERGKSERAGARGPEGAGDVEKTAKGSIGGQQLAMSGSGAGGRLGDSWA
jgi:hypothetical protein